MNHNRNNLTDKLTNWTPPENWLRIETLDAHTEGEPLRIVTGGFPQPEGGTMLERRRFAMEHLDHLRTALLLEPRGHADMYGCLVTPPATPDADFGVLFLHNEGFSTMCGHGILAVAKVAVVTGMVPAAEPVTTINIDTPAGRVTAFVQIRDDKVTGVSFRNVPSYVVELDAAVRVHGLGEIRYDLAFGGAYYAFVQARDVGLECRPDFFRQIVEKGTAIKRAVMGDRRIEHPFDADLGFLYGVIFVGPPEREGSHSRNVCVFAEGEVDRSPTGTGVSARAAIHHARGELAVGETIVVESLIGSRFTVRVAETTTFGPHAAVVPEVGGKTWITGRHTFFLDPDDPWKHGFVLR